jgi:hypothetical protein
VFKHEKYNFSKKRSLFTEAPSNMKMKLFSNEFCHTHEKWFRHPLIFMNESNICWNKFWKDIQLGKGKNRLERKPSTWHWWLTPIILATQEYCTWMPAWANSLGDHILKNPFTKRKLVDWLKKYTLKSSPRNTQKCKNTLSVCLFYHYLPVMKYYRNYSY